MPVIVSVLISQNHVLGPPSLFGSAPTVAITSTPVSSSAPLIPSTVLTQDHIFAATFMGSAPTIETANPQGIVFDLTAAGVTRGNPFIGSTFFVSRSGRQSQVDVLGNPNSVELAPSVNLVETDE